MTSQAAFHIKNSVFIIYLLEDEQELSLGMLIRLQRIYNFLLFHAVILSFLDVLKSFYSNFISFFGTNLLTQCLVPVAVFCLFFTSQKINTKQSPNAIKFYRELIWNIHDFWELESPQTEAHTAHKTLGCARGPWGALMGVGAHGGPFHHLSAL